jgi:hypothetical protein
MPTIEEKLDTVKKNYPNNPSLEAVKKPALQFSIKNDY